MMERQGLVLLGSLGIMAILIAGKVISFVMHVLNVQLDGNVFNWLNRLPH